MIRLLPSSAVMLLLMPQTWAEDNVRSKPRLLPPIASVEESRRLPIDLPSALRLAQAAPIDVETAQERVRLAYAQLDRAKVAWLPNIVWGADYARHDGRIQDIVGDVIGTHRGSMMFGVGPTAVVSSSDAIFGPLAARQVLQSRQASRQAAINDSALSVAETYFAIQQARGELAGALAAARLAADLVTRAEKLAAGLAPPVEVNRARTELARRRLASELAQERWQTAAAELARILRLDTAALIEPIDPPEMLVEMCDAKGDSDDLIRQGLLHRPELAAHQAIVQFTLTRLKQERLRPLAPSVLLRGNATNPGGTLAGGVFGGASNAPSTNFGGRLSFDVQLLWEFQNLGFGNKAAKRERESENRLAVLELFRTQDRIAAEVAQSHAQVRRAAQRVQIAESALADAHETATRTLEGISQTRRIGETLVLVFRPQEAVAAVQALDQAYRDYYTAVADSNRAQFRLHRAIGCPPSVSSNSPDRGPTPFMPPK